MNKTERSELAGIVRRNFKVAKAAIEQRKAELAADFEAQLAKEYEPHDKAWAEAIEAAKAAVGAANELIATAFSQFGDPKEFAPHVSIYWSPRGENGDNKRRVELRRVALTRLEAQAKAAKVKLDVDEAQALTRLAVNAFESDEAWEFLASVPTVAVLMPAVTLVEIEAGPK